MRAKRVRVAKGASISSHRGKARRFVTGLALVLLALMCAVTDAYACNAFVHDGSECLGSNPGCNGFCSFNQFNQQVCFYSIFQGNACDDGNANTVNDQCDDSGNCFGTLCGNGAVNNGEACDDGAANGTASSCCAASCVFQSAGTACDDGDASTVADQCGGGSTCAGTLCGNGAPDSGEVCDDGATNGTSVSCCSASCSLQAKDTVCDDGDATTAHDQCDGAGACAGVPCGNGTLDSGEACDDGAANGTSTSCCSGDCAFKAASATCDDDDASTVGDRCDSAGACAGKQCGNETKDAGEDCDEGDANGTLASCCSASCTLDSASTACDDGDASTVGDQCNDAGGCAGTLCGNTSEDAGEDCDEGVANGTLASCCSASCKFKAADASCDDSDADTTSDRCHASGVCRGDRELAINGSFEDGTTGDIANGWLARRLVMPPDRVGCSPGCFLELFGGKSVKRYYQYDEAPGSAGDSFTLKARSRARGVSESERTYSVEARIFYVDGTWASHALDFSPGTHPYEDLTTSFVADHDYTRIKISVLYDRKDGRVRFDDVSLVRH
jgi:hypothetical protein